MENKIYYAIELQSDTTGAGIINTCTTVEDAQEKYFEILKYAVKSTVRKHGAFVIDENGFVIEKPRVFDHTPEPEPVQEEEQAEE